MNRAADPKRVSRFFVSGGTERFSASAGGTFRLRRGCGAVCRRRKRRKSTETAGQDASAAFLCPEGRSGFPRRQVCRPVPFRWCGGVPPRWVGGSRGGLLVETAGLAESAVFLCPGGGGRAPLALRLRGGTGGVCSRSDLRPRRSGSGAVSRGREPNNGSGITFYGRKSSDFSK